MTEQNANNVREAWDVVILKDTQKYGFITQKTVLVSDEETTITFRICTEDGEVTRDYRDVNIVSRPNGVDAIVPFSKHRENMSRLLCCIVMGRFYMWINKDIMTSLCTVEKGKTGGLLSDDMNDSVEPVPPYGDKDTEIAVRIAQLINNNCDAWIKCAGVLE